MKISCPHCTNSDITMIEELMNFKTFIVYLCTVCSRKFSILVKDN